MAGEELKSMDLKWTAFAPDIYETDEDGSKLVYKYKDRMDGPPPAPSPDEKFYADIYLTARANQGFQPNTGKHYWEMAVNLDNLKIGVCTEHADVTNELGYDEDTWGVYIQTGECEHNRKARLKPEGVQRKLWRLVVTISGGRFGCLLDTNSGTLRLFFNGEYQGIAFDENSGLKGKTLYPAVGIAAFEDNNRTIGRGKKYCKFVKDMPVPAIPSVDKKVIC
eukprot:TRINITY_DN5328_c2_g1_i1.p1 TRINITY_DN5328_c2_g1~~TRINITY_DN5328_c2_g1_i1.p1  ORF type:complete len:239 (+),score=73.28 TRINITY_DN5328_c2_g1_i1:52-717(+)